MRFSALLSALAVGCACSSLVAALVGPVLARRARLRPKRAAWLAATSFCRRASMLWAAPAVLGVAALEDRLALAMTAIVGVGALGAQLMLRAGSIESRGRVATGRALGRIGGELLFLGAGALAAIAAFGHLIAFPPLALAGSAAILAGLAGKPRPSGTVAATLYAIGLVVLAWSD